MEQMMKKMNLISEESPKPEEPLYDKVMLSPKMKPNEPGKDIEEKLEKALFDLTDYKN